MMQELLTITDVSRLTGYSVGHIYNLVYRKEIPYKKLSRRALRFDARAIEDWVAERNVQTKIREALAR